MSAVLHFIFTMVETLWASSVPVELWYKMVCFFRITKGTRKQSKLCEMRSICVIETSCYCVKCLSGRTGVEARGEAGGNKTSGCLDIDESWTAGLQNYNDKTRHSAADQTQQQAGGTSNISCAQQCVCMCVWEGAGAEEHLWAPNRWLGGPRSMCAFAWMSASTLCVWLALRGSQRSQLAVADWEEVTVQTSRLFRFGGGTNSPALPESDKSINHL